MQFKKAINKEKVLFSDLFLLLKGKYAKSVILALITFSFIHCNRTYSSAIK